MLDINMVLKIAQGAVEVIKIGGEAAAAIKAGMAKAGVEVTDAEWDALAAGFKDVADTARREMGQE